MPRCTAGGLIVLLAALATAAPAPRAPGAIELVASRTGFRPSRVEVRKGEAVRLQLKSADDEHCFALDAFRIEKRLLPGRAVAVDFNPDRAGEFPFYCCLEPGNQALRGRLVVAD